MAASSIRAAYVVDALRTPFGRSGGALAAVHPVDLGAFVIRSLIDRTGIDPSAVEDVIFGCANQVGVQASCIARTSWLAADLPGHVPGTTVDRRCGSALQAVHFAAQAIMAGCADVIVAGGVENMSQVPIGSPLRATDDLTQKGFGTPWSAQGWIDRFGAVEPSQFQGADMIAEKWGLTRDELDQVAETSHARATAAWDAGRFAAEIVELPQLARDEGVRASVDRARMATLKPLREGGTITAAMASQISDGASSLLIASEDAVATHGLTPLARIHTMAVLGDDPIIMLTAPIPASRLALERGGLTVDDLGVVEINEAFASVLLAVQRDLELDPELVNPNGGAIAIGHPLGATGARLVTTLAHEMRRRGARYGLATLCEGGGQANALVLEGM